MGRYLFLITLILAILIFAFLVLRPRRESEYPSISKPQKQHRPKPHVLNYQLTYNKSCDLTRKQKRKLREARTGAHLI